MENVRRYYIQDSRSWDGNAAVFWRRNGEGYTSNLDEAEVLTEEQAKQRRWRRTDVLRDKAAVDAAATRAPRATGQLPSEPEWVRHEGG